jgi:predicted ATP-dependent Lon-type protease
VIISTENRRDFAELPAKVIDKLQIDFYSKPNQAVFKALVEV